VADDPNDPGWEVAEADLLDQRAPLESDALEDDDPLLLDTSDELFDRADRLEQQAAVPDGDEDDYPHD
jgi:hypothetical protein